MYNNEVDYVLFFSLVWEEEMKRNDEEGQERGGNDFVSFDLFFKGRKGINLVCIA